MIFLMKFRITQNPSFQNSRFQETKFFKLFNKKKITFFEIKTNE